MKRLKMLFLVGLWGMILLVACSQQEGAGVNSAGQAEPAFTEATGPAATERASSSFFENTTPQGPKEGSPTAMNEMPLATADRNIRLTPDAMPAGAESIPITTPELVIEPVPDEILNKLLADLQAQTGINTLSTDDYNIIRAQTIIWGDGSLGCPQPDVVYTQAPVEGYWIVIEAAGRTWDYRATESGSFVLCEQNLRP